MTVAGTDGTEGFNDIGHSEDARRQLRGLQIGIVEGTRQQVCIILQEVYVHIIVKL